MQETTIKSELINLINLLPANETGTAKKFLEFLIYKSMLSKQKKNNWLKEIEIISMPDIPKDCRFDREYIYNDIPKV
jgi:hypothetical protein